LFISLSPPSGDLPAQRHGIVVAAGERLGFGPKANTPQHAFRQLLRDRLAGLEVRQHELLHAVFAGVIPSNSDVENVLLYNVFDARANRLLVRGVRFEHDDAPRRAGVEYRYSSVPVTAGFAHWTAGTLAARWASTALVPGPSEVLLSRVWWSVRGAPIDHLATLAPGARFCAGIEVAASSPTLRSLARADSIKKLMDGLVSAFQSHPTSVEACSRIASRLGVDPRRVAEELSGGERAVLGGAHRGIGLTAGGVIWNPDDARLVAATVVFVERDTSTPVLSGWFAEGRAR
jgi:hypothetical protein